MYPSFTCWDAIAKIHLRCCLWLLFIHSGCWIASILLCEIAEEADPQDLSDTAGGVQIDATTLENSLAESQEAEYSAIPLPGIYPREILAHTQQET